MMTGDEYMKLLEQRRDQWLAEHPTRPHEGGIRPKFETPPLITWFIRDGDENLVNLPEPSRPQPKPKTSRRARRVVDVAALLARRDALVEQRNRIAGNGPADRACANLSPASRNRAAASAGRRRFAQMDRDLERYASLTCQIDQLNHQITRASARGGQILE